MRTQLLFVMLGACGSKSVPLAEPLGPMPLPPENTAAAITTEATSADCVPAGTYKVTWDFAAAKITRAGAIDDSCRSVSENLATQALAEMKINRAGSLSVGWPGPQTVLELGACSFEITSSSPAIAKIKFSGGTGNGTASFSIDTKASDARCKVENAVLMLAKLP